MGSEGNLSVGGPGLQKVEQRKLEHRLFMATYQVSSFKLSLTVNCPRFVQLIIASV